MDNTRHTKDVEESLQSDICIQLEEQGNSGTGLTRYKNFKDAAAVGNLVETNWVVVHACMQVGRAGRFGTKGLAITCVSTASDSDVLNQVEVGPSICLVQERFEVDIKELPEQIDT
ncbi:hypothetical protein D1007_42288 [Hordeum vulgare]|nr:hypothetical protein D1007_42288 [Hordeum vulgare]